MAGHKGVGKGVARPGANTTPGDAHDGRCGHCGKAFTEHDVRNTFSTCRPVTRSERGGKSNPCTAVVDGRGRIVDVHRECYWLAVAERDGL